MIGAHTSFSYSTHDEEFFEVTRFVREALEGNARILCVTDPFDLHDFHAYMAYSGVPVARAMARGQLQVRGVDDTYLAGGSFSPERMIAHYEESLQHARRDGWDGFWVAAGVSWAGRGHAVSEALVDYEKAVTPVLEEGGANALCLYDRRLLPRDLVDEAESAHPESLRAADRAAPPLALAAAEEPGVWRIMGEVDLSSAGRFGRLMASLVRDTREVRLDLEATRFVDVGGVRVLRWAASELQALHLRNVPGMVRWMVAADESMELSRGIEGFELLEVRAA